MTVEAPKVRTVDMFTGARTTAFFRALSEADHFCSELEDLKRLQDIEEEYGELSLRCTELLHENAELRKKLAMVTAERDNWRAAAEVGMA